MRVRHREIPNGQVVAGEREGHVAAIVWPHDRHRGFAIVVANGEGRREVEAVHDVALRYRVQGPNRSSASIQIRIHGRAITGATGQLVVGHFHAERRFVGHEVARHSPDHRHVGMRRITDGIKRVVVVVRLLGSNLHRQAGQRRVATYGDLSGVVDRIHCRGGTDTERLDVLGIHPLVRSEPGTCDRGASCV
ncbi:hypothetical protein D3C86_1327070 [compost metagenome]